MELVHTQWHFLGEERNHEGLNYRDCRQENDRLPRINGKRREGGEHYGSEGEGDEASECLLCMKKGDEVREVSGERKLQQPDDGENEHEKYENEGEGADKGGRLCCEEKEKETNRGEEVKTKEEEDEEKLEERGGARLRGAERQSTPDGEQEEERSDFEERQSTTAGEQEEERSGFEERQSTTDGEQEEERSGFEERHSTTAGEQEEERSDFEERQRATDGGEEDEKRVKKEGEGKMRREERQLHKEHNSTDEEEHEDGEKREEEGAEREDEESSVSEERRDEQQDNTNDGGGHEEDDRQREEECEVEQDREREEEKEKEEEGEEMNEKLREREGECGEEKDGKNEEERDDQREGKEYSVCEEKRDEEQDYSGGGEEEDREREEEEEEEYHGEKREKCDEVEGEVEEYREREGEEYREREGEREGEEYKEREGEEYRERDEKYEEEGDGEKEEEVDGEREEEEDGVCEEEKGGEREEECEGEGKDLSGCPQCQREPVLFCEDDQLALCWECGDSDRHQGHRVSPHQQALQDCREELMASMQPLFQCLKTATGAQQTCRQMAKHIPAQSEETESRIKEQFEELRRFLRAEEEARIAALREEQERKARARRERAERMRKEMCKLLHTLKASQMEMEMDGGDGLHFLQNYKKTVKRVWNAKQSPEKSYDSLIDVPKHVGNLRFRVWKKMQDICPYTPVTLDPNTAVPFLLVSDDLTSVRDSGDVTDDADVRLPDNPERFTHCGEMLGREVISTSVPQRQPLRLRGRRRGDSSTSWVVDVGNNSNWRVGVARRSVTRKSLVAACPENGYWAMSLRDSHYEALEASAAPLPLTAVPVHHGRTVGGAPGPRRVKVRVSQGSGRVCFSDADRHTHLYTFSHVSAESLQPYLATSCHRCPLRVLPATVAVTMSRQGPGGEEEEEEKEERQRQEEEGQTALSQVSVKKHLCVFDYLTIPESQPHLSHTDF